MSGDARWADACAAARLLAVDPVGLGGIVVRSGAGPVRDRWLQYLTALLPVETPMRRLPARVDDARLLGGLDLLATLGGERPAARAGLLAEADGGVVVAAMAERLSAGTAARLAAVLDSGEVVAERDGLALRAPARLAVVALDEGAGPDERVPAALAERLAFACALDGLGLADAPEAEPDRAPIAAARALLPQVTCDATSIEALCGAAAAFGIGSLRGPLFAVAAARVAAALAGRGAVNENDVSLAARLVLGHRATRLPAPPESAGDAEPPEPPPEAPPPESPDATPDTLADETPGAIDLTELTDIVLAATAAAIPPDMLAALASGTVRGPATGGGAGAVRVSLRRGRPLGARAGDPVDGARLNLVETLRTAAPWQRLRGRLPGARVEVRRSDFRIHRFAERAESTTIFAVDASGSAALARLAETKGAVELLLAEAYVKRTQVALIAFRGTTAELLLPPTRSLARAKRSLSDLAGGGGTPLALGLETALLLALGVRAKGRTPLVVVLTDGRANIARDGTAVRAAAESDALAAARRFRADGIAAAFIDTAPRARPEGAVLAAAMGARYAPLPFPTAAAMRDVASALA